MIGSLSIAVHAFVSCVSMSFSVDETNLNTSFQTLIQKLCDEFNRYLVNTLKTPISKTKQKKKKKKKKKTEKRKRTSSLFFFFFLQTYINEGLQSLRAHTNIFPAII